MLSWNIRFLAIFCCLLALSNGARRPLIHFGRCNVQRDVGYCQPRDQCWEKNVNFNSSSRSRCSSQVQTLVCCRRPPVTAPIVSPMVAPVLVPVTAAPVKPPLNLPQPGVCGVGGEEFADRVIGGVLAGIGEFPWMALLQYSNDGIDFSHSCGGTLIHERWVLTAAHCVPAPNAFLQLMQVRLGEWNTTSSPDCQIFKTNRVCAPAHLDLNVDRIIVHEQYTPTDIYPNDIALLRLSQIVSFTEFILPICLPAPNQDREYTYAGNSLDIAGWGLTKERSFDPSQVKMKAEVKVLPLANCTSIYPKLGSGQLCAAGELSEIAGERTITSTCRGDSGGPLMSQNSHYYQTGIVSLGSKTCNGATPMIFTRVEHYMPWIMATMNSNN